jgi:hypothetical protein
MAICYNNGCFSWLEKGTPIKNNKDAAAEEVERAKNLLDGMPEKAKARIWHNANSRQKDVFTKAGYKGPPPATPTTKKRLFGGKNKQ